MTAPTECGTSEPASALRAQSARHQSTETHLANLYFYRMFIHEQTEQVIMRITSTEAPKACMFEIFFVHLAVGLYSTKCYCITVSPLEQDRISGDSQATTGEEQAASL